MSLQKSIIISASLLFFGSMMLNAQNTNIQISKEGEDNNIQIKKQPLSKEELRQLIPVIDNNNEPQTTIDEPTNQFEFKSTVNGLEYYFVNDQPGQNLQIGDISSMHIKYRIGDSIIVNTREINNNIAVEHPIQKSLFPGDLTEGLLLMSSGDSAIFRMPLKRFTEQGSIKMPPFAKEDDYAVWYVKVERAENMDAFNQRKEAERKVLLEKEIQEINALLKSKKKKFYKTDGGVFVVVEKEGQGEKPSIGSQVTVNYTGKLLDGTVFDSNTDPQFKHVEPFTFPLSANRVIKGWDEGVSTMKKGTKATLYIPSSLAYGEQSPSPLIPSNSILVFDIELIDFK